MAKKSSKNPINMWKKWSKRRKILTIVIAVVVILIIIACIIFITRGRRGRQPEVSVQQTEVAVGNITNSITGTGTLAIDEGTGIKVPTGIVIKKVKVESGDAVKAGDTLATIDTSSIPDLMQEVQDEIDALDDTIENFEDESGSENLTSNVGGEVLKVYAKKGKSVLKCMSKHGALVVIKLSSGEKIKVTATDGTVSSVNVSKGDTVESGDTLLTIKQDENSAEYQALIKQQKSLTKTMNTLAKLSVTGKITADCDGIVGSVNVSQGNSVGSATDTSASSSSLQMSYDVASNDYKVSGLSYQKSDSDVDVSGGENNAKAKETKTLARKTATGVNATNKTNNAVSYRLLDGDYAVKTYENAAENSEQISFKVVSSGTTTLDTLVIETPQTGASPQNNISSSDGSYTGSISWSDDDNVFESSKTYSALITLDAADGYVFSVGSILSVESGVVSGIGVGSDQKTLTFTITFPQTDGDDLDDSSDLSSVSSSSKTSDLGKNSDSNLDSAYSYGDDADESTTIQSSNSGLKTSSSLSSTGVSSGESDESSLASSLNSESLSEVTVFTIASNDVMTLSVSVDELDINDVEKGQEARITLDAIDDENFTGTVTKVGGLSSGSGSGVAKYTVEISVQKDERMREGMNASATVVTENRENVLTLPVSALQERGNMVFVYTDADSDGNLTDPVEITTGVSDGDTVEVVSGLGKGDTVYYIRTGDISLGNGAGGFSPEDFLNGEGGFSPEDFINSEGGFTPEDFMGGGNSERGGRGSGNMPNRGKGGTQ